jgi:hypothetical protein
MPSLFLTRVATLPLLLARLEVRYTTSVKAATLVALRTTKGVISVRSSFSTYSILANITKIDASRVITYYSKLFLTLNARSFTSFATIVLILS